MNNTLEQVAEVGARVGNTVTGTSVVTAAADAIGIIDLESWALITTMICAVLGLVFSTVLSYWHKRRMQSMQAESVDIQRQLAAGRFVERQQDTGENDGG